MECARSCQSVEVYEQPVLIRKERFSETDGEAECISSKVECLLSVTFEKCSDFERRNILEGQISDIERY